MEIEYIPGKCLSALSAHWAQECIRTERKQLEPKDFYSFGTHFRCPDQSVSLVPDGSRGGQFAVVDTPTPGAENSGEGCDQAVTFRRGDATGDGGTDITDGVFILNYLFLGTRAPDCMDAADTDDNGNVDLSDAIYKLAFLFQGGPPAVQGEGCTEIPDCPQNQACP